MFVAVNVRRWTMHLNECGGDSVIKVLDVCGTDVAAHDEALTSVLCPLQTARGAIPW